MAAKKLGIRTIRKFSALSPIQLPFVQIIHCILSLFVIVSSGVVHGRSQEAVRELEQVVEMQLLDEKSKL